jgi:hypothetical protein
VELVPSDLVLPVSPIDTVVVGLCVERYHSLLIDLNYLEGWVLILVGGH